MKPTIAQHKKIKQTLMLQYPNVDFNLDNIDIIISKKTRRIKSISKDDVLIFSLRTSDGRFLPTMIGGKILLKLGFNKNRVYVSKDAVPFVASGKSAFCKHITKVDNNIVPELEVFLMSEEEELLAIGTATQPGYAMLLLDKGIAVKSKHHK